MNLFANVECTAIPDGVAKDPHGNAYLRLSVVLRPDPTQDSDAVPLLEWPAVIPTLNFEVSMAPPKDPLIKLEGVPLPEFLPAGMTAQDAEKWWRCVWKRPEVAHAYHQMMMLKSGQRPADIEFFSYSMLARIVRAQAQADVEVALRAAHYRSIHGVMNGVVEGDIAEARRNDPNAAAVRRHDAQALLGRELFADTPFGDSLDRTRSISHKDGIDTGLGLAALTPAQATALQDTFRQVRQAIDAAATPGTAAASTTPWNPFLAEAEQTEVPKSVDDLFQAPYPTSVFGTVRPQSPVSTLGAPVGSASAAPAVAWGVRQGVEAFRRAMNTDEELGAAPAPAALHQASTPLSDQEARELAARHVASLQAHPALRKFVQLIVDFRIPLDSVPPSVRNAGRGVVSVQLSGRGKSPRVTHTAFELQFELDNDQENFFEPCPESVFTKSNPTLVPSLPLHRGVVRLNIPQGGKDHGPKRFRIEVIDAIAGFLSRVRGLQATGGALRMGAPINLVPAGEAGLRTRGLMVLDTEPMVTAQIAEKRRATPPLPGEPKLFYAEDLVEGYRVDLVAPGGTVYPAGNRKLAYDVICEAFNLPKGAISYPQFKERDEGYILPAGRSWSEDVPASTTAPPSQRDVLMVSEVLVSWDGSNIGLPAIRQQGGQPPEQDDELPVAVTYDYAPEPGPILRAGGRYRFMLRARKLNGSSVTSGFAESHAKDHALGDPDDPYADYTFVPVERAPVPTVLVPEGQRLVSPGVDDDLPTSQNLILKTGETAVRMLVSPRIAFDLAEQLGQFDPVRLGAESSHAAGERALRRVRRGSYLMLERDNEGDFPLYGADQPMLAGQPKYDRAMLFKLREPPKTDPAVPYYVDGTLCFLGTRLLASKATTPFSIEASSADGELSFWRPEAKGKGSSSRGFDPDRLKPIKLEVKAVRAGKSRLRNLGYTEFRSGTQVISVPTLCVEVAPADTLTLEIWLNRTAKMGMNHSIVRAAIGQAIARANQAGKALTLFPDSIDNPDVREDWWLEQCRAMRINTLSDVLQFRIEHAVALPLHAPSFLQLGCTRTIDKSAWHTIAVAPRGADQRGASSTFAWGAVSVDRKSTKEVWAECIWLNFDPKVAVQRTTEHELPWEIDQQGLWAFNPVLTTGRLFTIEALAPLAPKVSEKEVDYLQRANVIDLITDEMGNLRNLAADFRSDGARRLVVRLLARSRFEGPSAGPQDKVISSASAQDLVAFFKGGPRPEGVEEIWLMATRPPTQPTLLKDKGTLYQRRLGRSVDLPVPGHQGRGRTLSHIYRCWLGPDWFSSGEGEQLAIVCRDPAQEKHPDWLLSQLSRWGGDMTMAPAQAVVVPPADLASATFLSPAQVVGTVTQRALMYRELKEDQAEPLSKSHGVLLGLLTPRFHTGTGRWYCDMEITPTAAYKVGVQLCLVRYQPNAIEGCKLSRSVRADAFFLHQPWTFSAIRRGGEVEVIAMGPAYTEKAPMTVGLEGAETAKDIAGRAAEPLVVVELERLGSDGDKPLIVIDSNADPVVTTSLAASTRREFGDTRRPDIPSGWTRWTMTLVIPKEEPETRFAVRVSLASTHANSLAAPGSGQPGSDGPLVYLPEPMVVQLEI